MTDRTCILSGQILPREQLIHPFDVVLRSPAPTDVEHSDERMEHVECETVSVVQRRVLVPFQIGFRQLNLIRDVVEQRVALEQQLQHCGLGFGIDETIGKPH